MDFGKFLYSIFRFTGDIVHLYTMLILFKKIRETKSVSGLSLKTQFLYLVVFVARYLDLFYFWFGSFLDVYNFIMKIIYISLQSVLIYMIRYKYFYSYDVFLDTFNVYNLVVPCAVLAVFLKSGTYGLVDYFVEFLYTFSVLLESVAILPQLVQLQESGEAETLTSQFIFFLGLYRLFYVVNWIVKLFFGLRVNHLLLATGVIQTLLYADFFVIYYKYVFTRKGNERLPKRSK
ncbi:ER lumen protein retaining receptor [Trachipleistophora hominis]|uniref:ER lumen protein-retaining receptor n=1 Tax=Trachipleistophora hominis TaxID=72359 RepID=L7JTT1_TRAHO|nr:ER lumen protein retaining receptor [Trachipleistophora hominis]